MKKRKCQLDKSWSGQSDKDIVIGEDNDSETLDRYSVLTREHINIVGRDGTTDIQELVCITVNISLFQCITQFCIC